MRRNLNAYLGNISGNFSVIGALSFTTLLLAIGIALDIANINPHAQRLQNQLDTAILAGLKAVSESSAESDEEKISIFTTEANNVFAGNNTKDFTNIVEVVYDPTTDEFTIKGQSEFPSLFLQHMNIESYPVKRASSASGSLENGLNLYIVYDRSITMSLPAETHSRAVTSSFTFDGVTQTCFWACHNEAQKTRDAGMTPKIDVVTSQISNLVTLLHLSLIHISEPTRPY